MIRDTFPDQKLPARPTYAQWIKNKTTKARTSAPRPTAKAARPAAPKAVAEAPKPAPPSAPPSALPTASGDLEQLKNELQRVNQEISRIARVSRPDAARQMNLPEKQELLRQKAVLDSKIRAASRT